MPKYKFQEGGKTYSVMANNADEASSMIDEAISHLRQSAKPVAPEMAMQDEGAAQAAAAGQMLPLLKTGLERMTPLGSIKEIGGQLAGTRPSSPARAGFAAVDIAASPLLAFARPAVGPALSYGSKLAGGLASGAASGGTMLAAEKAGFPPAVQIPLGIAAGIATGRMTSPEMTLKAVPQGEEAAALARVGGKMGLPIPAIPAAAKPRDIRAAFKGAEEVLGPQVGAAKEAALATEKTAPEVVTAVREAVGKSLVNTGVPLIDDVLRPSLAKESAAAEKMIEQVGKLSEIPVGASGKEAMTLANNILESTKKMIAESKKMGTGLAGRTTQSATKEWQRAIDNLGPEEQVAAARSLDALYSKLKTIGGLAEKASGKMVGQTPQFSPRNFIFLWENLPEAGRKKFTAQEIAMMDALVTQKPGWVNSVIGKAIDFAKQKGLKGLSWHPTARFYEEGARAVGPRAASVSPLPWVRKPEEQQ